MFIYLKNNTCFENYPLYHRPKKRAKKGKELSIPEGWGKKKDFWPEYWPLKAPLSQLPFNAERVLFYFPSLLSWSHDITYVITESRSLKRKSNIGCNDDTTQNYHGADDDDLLTQDINTTGLDHWLFTPVMFLENNIPTALYPKLSRLGLKNRVPLYIDSACSYLPTKCYNK